MTVGKLLPPRVVDGLPGRVHRNDFMLWPATVDSVGMYRDGAQRVIADIDQALHAVGRDFADVDRWLDYGCGYGRVLRYLLMRVDASRVWATAVLPEAVRFCEREFGVHPLLSVDELPELGAGRFDFVYAISVITHLNPAASVEFLRLMGNTVSDDGVVLFTTQGICTVEHLAHAGLTESVVQRRASIAEELRTTGLSYVPYEYYRTNYGVTFHARDWVESAMRAAHGDLLKLVSYVPGAMPFAQDTFVFQRS